MNEQITIKELFSLDKTIAAGIFEVVYIHTHHFYPVF